MFTIINNVPNTIVGVIISGKVTKEDFDRLNPLLQQHAEQFNEIKLLLEYQDFKWPTLKAMWEDLKTGFKYWKDIKAVATISTKDWIEDSANVMGAVLPGIKAKGFEPKNREKAIAWLVKE